MGKTDYLLLITAGDDAVKKYALKKGIVSIGRSDRGTNDLVLNDRLVSGKHALITYNKKCCIQDLKSKNGTCVNGVLLNGYEKKTLNHYDEIRIGEHTILFLKTKQIRSTCQIEILSGRQSGKKIRISQKILKIGRSLHGNDLIMNDKTVSSHHAELIFTDGRFYIKDMGSTNKTIVDEKMLEAGEKVLLEHHNIIKLGNTAFRFHEITDKKNAAYKVDTETCFIADQRVTLVQRIANLFKKINKKQHCELQLTGEIT